MRRAILDPCFGPRERRWRGYLEAAIWLASTMLVVALAAWSLGPY
mgnify:CR=1 FL=1